MSPDSDDGTRQAAITRERQRLRILRQVVDLTSHVLCQGNLSREEAEELVSATRRRALELFPDKEETFDLILAPRFARLMDEFARPGIRGARVLPFQKPQTRPGIP